MTEYRIFETRQFAKDLREIAKAGQPDVARKLKTIVYSQLRRHPHFGPHIRKLRAYSPDTWRHRIGAWRFFNELDEEVVSMLAATHRGSSY